MRRAVWTIAALALIAVVVIGLSQAADDASRPSQQDFDLRAAQQRLAGAPAPLASLHEQSTALLDGGVAAFEARLESLRGYPVVINKWGSWCGPCRAEFPVFQEVATRKGKRVAFLGINGQDGLDDAREFLAANEVPYPSYRDPDNELAKAAGGHGPFPMTIFVDRKGDVEIALAKPYETAADLEADIKKYLRA